MSETLKAPTKGAPKGLLFVSHSTPDDDKLALWLTLRLAAEGYGVWCDLTRLLGGEDFWNDIEGAIREKTCKFLFILSKASNQKPGCLKELALATKVQRQDRIRDFVVPLAADDLSSSDYNIELTRLNAISFSGGWANGLSKLLKKLERDKVLKDPRFGPAVVAGWWRANRGRPIVVSRKPELLTSNLYAITPPPLFFHRLAIDLRDTVIEPSCIPYPAEWFGEYLVSFAPARDLETRLGTDRRIMATSQHSVGNDTRHGPRGPWSYRDERSVVAKLLNGAWRGMLAQRELPIHMFSSGTQSFYFKLGFGQGNEVRFRANDGRTVARQMVGYKTMTKADKTTWIRYWHIAADAKPTLAPRLGFLLRTHVLFSEDGDVPWESVTRQLKARRSQCKDWWNDKWRDINHAVIRFVAGSEGMIRLSVGSSSVVEVSTDPVPCLAPMSFDEAGLADPELIDQGEGDAAESDEEVDDGEQAEPESQIGA